MTGDSAKTPDDDALRARVSALERVVAELRAALEECEEKSRFYFESSVVGKSITLPSGEISVNRAFCEMLGYSADELSTRRWQDITHPDDVAATQRHVDPLLAGEMASARFVKRYLRKDGAIVWADVNTLLRRDRDGQPLCFMTSMSDITERKRTEDALRTQADRLRNLHRTFHAILHAVESPETIVQTALLHLRSLLHCQRASVGIFDLEKKQVRVFAADVNGETVVETGTVLAEDAYGDLEVLRHGRMEIVEDTSTVTFLPAVTRILRVEGVRSSINVPLVSALELYGALNVGWENARAISPEETEIAGEVASQVTLAIEQARLLEAAKRYAAELEQRVTDRTALLEAANAELEAFSYSVSHDLRAPLRAVEGFTHILLEDFAPHLDAEGQRVCAVISQSARDMGQLIDDLLAFSRVGRAALAPSPVDMVDLATAAFLAVTTAAERGRVELRLGPLPPASGDPTLLRLVWGNLLSNAVKFSSREERPVIEVSAASADGEVVYSVVDNGAGFDMRYVGKLFGVFQRLHSSKEYAGTGVGLAIVQRIVSRHGGRVWAEGEIDKGASFHFTLEEGP